MSRRTGAAGVLYLHGNGGALRYRVDRFRALTADGTGLVALSYRGYAGSSGRPTEAGLIEDATRGLCVRGRALSGGEAVVWGESLGTGVAVALAAERKSRSRASCSKRRSHRAVEIAAPPIRSCRCAG